MLYALDRVDELCIGDIEHCLRSLVALSRRRPEEEV